VRDSDGGATDASEDDPVPSGGAADGGNDEREPEPSDDDQVRVWLVERTYSDDEQNLIILTYATTDGERDYRMERALTGLADVRETTAAKLVDPSDLGHVTDPETREWYADEASRMAESHAPDDTI
jgi:hypothetical protein